MAKKEGPHLFEVFRRGDVSAGSTPGFQGRREEIASPSSRVHNQKKEDSVAESVRSRPDWDEKTIAFSYTQIVFYTIALMIAFVLAYILGYEAGKRENAGNQRKAYQVEPRR